MFTDEMEEAIDKVQEFIDKLREIGSKKVLAVMPDLEEWLDNLLRASEKAIKSRELEEQTAKEHFELYHRRLTGISEEFTALARKQPESRCNPFIIVSPFYIGISLGNTAQSPPDGFALNLRTYFPSSCTEIP